MSSSSSTLQITYPSSPAFPSLLARNFNTLPPNRVPVAICTPHSVSEIQSAVAFAIKANWRISVRSGGHSWAQWGVRDEALLIDLGEMKEVAMVKEKCMATEEQLRGVRLEEELIVSASPAVTGKELNDFLAGQAEARMFPGGHCPDVGLGGFVLQGGMGWNAKNWAWGCEYLVAADVVTASGLAIRCSTTENEDLFWAIRGSGPGCPAIVTKFYLLTRPDYPAMYSSTYIYPLSSYATVISWVAQISLSFDSDTEIVCLSAFPHPSSDFDNPAATTISPGSLVSESNIIAIFTCFKSSLSEANIALQPAQESRPAGPKIELFCKKTSFDEEYAAQTIASPLNHRYAADNAFLINDCDIASTLETAFCNLPSTESYALYFSMAPTSRRKLPDMAVSLQSDHYVAIYVGWKHEEDDERCKGWLAGVFQGIEKNSMGSYLGDADFRVRKTRFWGVEQGKRLMEIRRQWDGAGRICGFLGAERVGGNGREELDNRLGE